MADEGGQQAVLVRLDVRQRKPMMGAWGRGVSTLEPYGDRSMVLV